MNPAPAGQERRPRVGVLLLVAAVAGALAFGPRLFGLFPLGHDVTDANSAGDDWLTYHRFASSVVDGGWTIPAVDGSYSRPGGFAYVYFVASIYSTFGVRSEAVYLIQGLLLMAGIVGLVLTFGPRLPGGAAWLLTVSLVPFLAVDLFRYTTFRMLSENLLVPLIVLLLWLVLKATATPRTPWFVGAGIVCGLCALTRPNVVFFGPAIAVLLVVHPWNPQRALQRKSAAAFLVAFAVVSSVMPIRNLAASGSIGVMEALRPQGWLLPSTAVQESATPVERLADAVSFYAKRAAFALGIPEWLSPRYRVRPHWLLMWACLAAHVIGQRPREFWEVLLLTLLAAYLLPLLAVAHISSYGVRMLAPAVLLALPLAASGAAMLATRARARLTRP